MIEQRQALLRLLCDDDADTLKLVKAQLSQAGAPGLAELRILLAAADPAAASHLRDVIAEIEEREADAVFAQFCRDFSSKTNLEEAAWRLASTFLPGDDFIAERELLDIWGAEVRRRLPKARTPLDRMETLSEYLSTEVELRGNIGDYYNLANSILPNVINSRLGIPISLSQIYMFVAQRAGLFVQGVSLPGHFLVRYEELFFDPFHGGQRVGLDECRALMMQQNLVLRPEHLAPATARQIMVRALTNLYYVAEGRDAMLAAKVAVWIDALRG